MATTLATAPEHEPSLPTESVLHDIRGCLTIIRGQCCAIVRDGRATASTIDRLRAIDDEVGRIASALDQVRAALGPGRPRSAPLGVLDVASLVAAAAARMDGLAHPGQLSLDTTALYDSALVVGDVDQLHRVLDNVLLNAVRGARGGPIAIVVTGGPPGLVRIVIQNDDRSDDRVESGWGIGLQIVRGIVRAHHGTVRIDRGEQTFRVVIALPSVPVGACPCPS